MWQQALLIDTPRAYATSPDLPFVVFHYPPLYHFAVRAMVWLVPDWLSAGRVVSIASTAGLALVVAGLVLVGSTAPGSQRRQATMLCACLTGLLVLCVHGPAPRERVIRCDRTLKPLRCFAVVLVENTPKAMTVETPEVKLVGRHRLRLQAPDQGNVIVFNSAKNR